MGLTVDTEVGREILDLLIARGCLSRKRMDEAYVESVTVRIDFAGHGGYPLARITTEEIASAPATDGGDGE